MKKETTIAIITNATRGKCSYYGNPSFVNIEAETIEGDLLFFHKTQANSSAGYEINNALYYPYFYAITHHATASGAAVIDYIKLADNQAALQLQKIDILTENNEHTAAALFICQIFRDFKGARTVKAIEALEDSIGNTLPDLQLLRAGIVNSHARELAELKRKAEQEAGKNGY